MKNEVLLRGVEEIMNEESLFQSWSVCFWVGVGVKNGGTFLERWQLYVELLIQFLRKYFRIFSPIGVECDRIIGPRPFRITVLKYVTF